MVVWNKEWLNTQGLGQVSVLLMNCISFLMIFLSKLMTVCASVVDREVNASTAIVTLLGLTQGIAGIGYMGIA